MKKVTYELDDNGFYSNDECINYLKSIKGIKKVDIQNGFYPIFNVSYDETIISSKTIYWEICLFLNIPHDFSALSFDYHPGKKVETYTIDLTGLCCEFCYRNIIEEIFTTKGIMAMDGHYDHIPIDKSETFGLKIKYDNQIISLSEIKKLEEKIRSIYC